jgi:hypothetical protein
MIRALYGSSSATIVAKTDTGSATSRNGCQPMSKVSLRGASTAARHAASASPLPSIQRKTGRTRFQPSTVITAVVRIAHASAKMAIVQNCSAVGFV